MAEVPVDKNLERFAKKMSDLDELGNYILKGHLLVEEMVTRIVESFVFHREFIDEARLTFHQKLQLARATSTSDHGNSMWGLISILNSLRNEMSHSLDRPKLQPKLDALRHKYFEEFPKESSSLSDEQVALNAVLACMGFLSAHESEVERFRWWVEKLDRAINQNEDPAVILKEIVGTNGGND